jgi:hypothetical protein
MNKWKQFSQRVRGRVACIIVVFLIAIIGTGAWAGFPKASFTVHAVGEDGSPVVGAKASFVFCSQFDSSKHILINGLTNGGGNFSAEGYTDGETGGKIEKMGYYWGSAGVPVFMKDDGVGRWLPYGATYTSVLRKIEKPVPVYARALARVIPEIGKQCGFDLIVADWVAPYGGGKTADIYVTVTKQVFVSRNDFDVSETVSFPNPGDGIQATELPEEYRSSIFRWPRLAPESGYLPSISFQRIWKNTGGNTTNYNTAEEGKAYYFRVRSEEQDGRIVSALYGKISSGFGLGPVDNTHGSMGFTYGLNPNPNDRNMEMGENLFKNLPVLERPHGL